MASAKACAFLRQVVPDAAFRESVRYLLDNFFAYDAGSGCGAHSPKVSTRVLWMARNLDDSRPAAAMEATGARLFRGEGKLRDLHTVAVGDEQLIARRGAVIANGSTAASGQRRTS
jgi:pyruvate/2-oxoglutarate dehydrogenase complex dihydrolipoamide dehydrogenase (E3) component